MIFIDQNRVQLQIPQGWESRAQTAYDEVAATADNDRATAVKDRGKVWRDLKDLLCDVSHQKCWYCESKQVRSDNAVDHFRPKNEIAERPNHKGYWWLAFQWQNYRYSCTLCNSHRVDQDGGTDGGKHDHFPLFDEDRRCLCESDNLDEEQPLLLDPCNQADPPLLWFDENGEPNPNPNLCGNKDGYMYKRVKTSIHLYHLDHGDLVELRATLCTEIRSQLREADKMLKRIDRGDMTARESFQNTMTWLKSKLSVDQEYSATAKIMLLGMRKNSPAAEAVLLGA